MDTRAESLLGSIAERLDDIGLDQAAYRRITGKTLSANLSLGKIDWLRRNEPETFGSTAAFLDTQAFLAERLTGRRASSWGSADPSGLFDLAARRWSEPIMAAVGLDERRLAEALPPGDIIGEIGPEAAEACGLPPGLPLVAGLGDGQSAGLGCGLIDSGLAGSGASYLSLGTSVVSGSASASLVVDPAFRTSFGADGNFFLETVILGGGRTIAWFMENFGLECRNDDELRLRAELRIRAEAETIAPGADGLTLVPYWAGAMNPYWEVGARGLMAGWSFAHGRPHFYRAILEGLAYELRFHTEGVERALGRGIDTYLVTGGGLLNSLWLRIIADATGRAVRAAPHAESATLGAGILAATAARLHADVPAAVRAMVGPPGEALRPSPENQARYDELYRKTYTGLYPSLQR